MIALPWYFYIIAALTAHSVFCDLANTARFVVHDKGPEGVGFLVSAAGLLACAHMIMAALS
jgi:hypothetical protein